MSELIEKLASLQHAVWSRWIVFIFDQAERHKDGSLVIPEVLADKWQKEAKTAYAELQEARKRLYQDEVARMMPSIEEYTKGQADVSKQAANT